MRTRGSGVAGSAAAEWMASCTSRAVTESTMGLSGESCASCKPCCSCNRSKKSSSELRLCGLSCCHVLSTSPSDCKLCCEKSVVEERCKAALTSKGASSWSSGCCKSRSSSCGNACVLGCGSVSGGVCCCGCICVCAVVFTGGLPCCGDSAILCWCSWAERETISAITLVLPESGQVMKSSKDYVAMYVGVATLSFGTDRFGH